VIIALQDEYLVFPVVVVYRYLCSLPEDEVAHGEVLGAELRGDQPPNGDPFKTGILLRNFRVVFGYHDITILS